MYYNGDEKIINNGVEIPYSMLSYWQWAYSNIIHNMQRGNFAEFIVKSALEIGHVPADNAMKFDLYPYDLDGPVIKSTGKPARIEVKSAAFVQLWDIKHPDKASFSIAKAKMPDETGDYPHDAERTRNNDLYVFTLYTATDRNKNMLNMCWWKFYVLPTYRINQDDDLCDRKTISLAKVREMCRELTFDELCPAIIECCESISEEYAKRNTPPSHNFLLPASWDKNGAIHYWTAPLVGSATAYRLRGWIENQPLITYFQGRKNT